MKLSTQNNMIMAKYKSVFSIIALGISIFANAQSLEMSESALLWEGRGEASLLEKIEQNNTTLIALRAEAEARKLDNLTGITLADPEVGYKRMWEGAEQTGNLTELTVSQSIDLPTVLGYRSRAAQGRNHLIDEEYRLVRMDILLDAQLTCIDLAYYNALASELDRRLAHARRVAEAERCRLACGDTDALSYNNVLLSLAALEAERARVTTEQHLLACHLTALNGGKEMEELKIDSAAPREEYGLHLEDNFQFPVFNSQLSFDSWYAEALEHSPAIALARVEREAAGTHLTLAKAEHLPTFTATYITERHTIGDRSQGIAVGMSLPLWANKRRVSTARASLEAAQAREADTHLQLRIQLQAGYERVKGLHHTATLYRRALAEANNTELLARAMDEGHISVLEYLQGVELYYDYLDRSLNAERDYQRALAELEAWKL